MNTTANRKVALFVSTRSTMPLARRTEQLPVGTTSSEAAAHSRDGQIVLLVGCIPSATCTPTQHSRGVWAHTADKQTLDQPPTTTHKSNYCYARGGGSCNIHQGPCAKRSQILPDDQG